MSRAGAESRQWRKIRQGGQSVCDPITLEIVRGALIAIQSEMEAVIERTAMSPFIREKKDFYAALYDAEGRLIARL